MRFSNSFFTLILLSSSLASALPSYLFGRNALEGLGRTDVCSSQHYVKTSQIVADQHYFPVVDNYGAEVPTQLRLLIKDDSVLSPMSWAFVQALNFEKPNLMKLYHISNQDYNRLALLAFGILGKETKFGASYKYKFKESAQASFSLEIPLMFPGLIPTPFKINLGTAPSPIYMTKLAKLKAGQLEQALATGDAYNLLNNSQVSANSRGLTQIKVIPQMIKDFYCVDEEQLDNPRVAAISTLGFLADSLKITRNLVRNHHLNYADSTNIFDYVLYVYFGGARQLVNPIFGNKMVTEQTMGDLQAATTCSGDMPILPSTCPIAFKTHQVYTQLNETATPSQNIYVQYVKQYIQKLAIYEKDTSGLPTARNSACSPTR